jgi:hypothetical protein
MTCLRQLAYFLQIRVVFVVRLYFGDMARVLGWEICRGGRGELETELFSGMTSRTRV